MEGYFVNWIIIVASILHIYSTISYKVWFLRVCTYIFYWQYCMIYKIHSIDSVRVCFTISSQSDSVTVNDKADDSVNDDVNNFNGDVNVNSVDNGDWDMMAVYMYYSFSAIFLFVLLFFLYFQEHLFFSFRN